MSAVPRVPTSIDRLDRRYRRRRAFIVQVYALRYSYVRPAVDPTAKKRMELVDIDRVYHADKIRLHYCKQRRI